MPMREQELQEARGRVSRMLMDTIATFELLEKNADEIYGPSAARVRAAINEYLQDFIRNPRASGMEHPETLIFSAPLATFQRAGFYGAQLDLKDRQVTEANRSLRERIVGGVKGFFSRPFRKWVDVINNFLRSLTGATGLSEALAELKDCLRDELPEDDGQR